MTMFIEYNPNPVGRKVGDCAVRAISKVLDMGWEAAYIALVINGLSMGNMPSSNEVIGSVLRQHGYMRKNLPDDCPACYTIEDFCEDNPQGRYVLGANNHVVAAIDGNYFDTWDSGTETVMYAWYRKEKDNEHRS